MHGDEDAYGHDEYEDLVSAEGKMPVSNASTCEHVVACTRRVPSANSSHQSVCSSLCSLRRPLSPFSMWLVLTLSAAHASGTITVSNDTAPSISSQESFASSEDEGSSPGKGEWVAGHAQPPDGGQRRVGKREGSKGDAHDAKPEGRARLLGWQQMLEDSSSPLASPRQLLCSLPEARQLKTFPVVLDPTLSPPSSSRSRVGMHVPVFPGAEAQEWSACSDEDDEAQEAQREVQQAREGVEAAGQDMEAPVSGIIFTSAS